MRGGHALPAAMMSSGLESPRPELETGEASLLLGIRQATGFILFMDMLSVHAVAGTA